MDQLMEIIDSIKHFIPDQKYIDIMNAITDIYNQRSNTANLLRLGPLTVTMEPVDEDEENKFMVLEWKTQEGEIHRDNDKPALIRYLDGCIHCEAWYQNNKLHREGDLPALIEYNNGHIINQKWYIHDVPSRIDCNKPTVITYYRSGCLHSETRHSNGRDYTIIEYYENGSTKCCTWGRDGELYREDNLPAVIRYYENGRVKVEAFSLNGRLRIIRYKESGHFMGETTFKTTLSSSS